MKKAQRTCDNKKPSDSRTECQRIPSHKGDHRARIWTGSRHITVGWRNTLVTTP